MTKAFLDRAPILLAAAGTCFLFYEVWTAQRVEFLKTEFEALTAGMAAAADLANLFRTNSREFWIRVAAESFKWSRATAEYAATAFSDADIAAQNVMTNAIADGLYEKGIPDAGSRWKATRARYERLTFPAALRRRRGLLLTGFVLLLLSALIQGVAALVKPA